MGRSRQVTTLDAAGLDRALTGVHVAFAVAVGFAVLAAFFALFIRDEDARATMVARSRAA